MNYRPPMYITDMGEPLPVTDLGSGAWLQTIPRYGVWAWDPARDRYQVVETGEDLAFLQAAFGVPSDRVIPFHVRS